MAIDKPNEQWIIIYENKDDHSIKKYTTVYDDEQAKHYLVKCVEKFGKHANVRCVPGSQLSV